MDSTTRKHLTYAWAHSLTALLALTNARDELDQIPGPPTPAHDPLTQALPLLRAATIQLSAILDLPLPTNRGA